MSLISRKFAGFLGLDDYTIGDVVTIRGKKYKFPSYADLYNASLDGVALRQYQVNDEISNTQNPA